jgi:hypothetical protein
MVFLLFPAAIFYKQLVVTVDPFSSSITAVYSNAHGILKTVFKLLIPWLQVFLSSVLL